MGQKLSPLLAVVVVVLVGISCADSSAVVYDAKREALTTRRVFAEATGDPSPPGESVSPTTDDGPYGPGAVDVISSWHKPVGGKDGEGSKRISAGQMYGCSTAFAAVANHITETVPPADQASNTETNHFMCSKVLLKAVYRTVDSDGQLVEAGDHLNWHVGIQCDRAELVMYAGDTFGVPWQAPAKPLTTFICKSGSIPEDCATTSSDFVMGFGWAYPVHPESPQQNVVPGQIVLPGETIGLEGACENEIETSQDPLIIDMTPFKVPQVEYLSMSNPNLSNAVSFDILGAQAQPAHTPRRVSWPRNPNYAFLALPNDAERVTGIDQLFGNKTLGPDGRFAKDGFAALAKYDANHDGQIDERDPVYARLRLWSDQDMNGIAWRGELRTLAAAGIETIDLGYDPSFSEHDEKGNVARFKSTVMTREGTHRLIFDLWVASP
jgi:hypothetical protein